MAGRLKRPPSDVDKSDDKSLSREKKHRQTPSPVVTTAASVDKLPGRVWGNVWKCSSGLTGVCSEVKDEKELQLVESIDTFPYYSSKERCET